MDWLVDTLKALVAPALIGVGALVSWLVRSQFEQYRQLERSIAEQQRETYAGILDPFIQLFANMGGGGSQDGVISQVLSKDYRKTTFDLTLFGSDDVVRAYNNMMQYLYTTPQDKVEPSELMGLWGELLRQIRRSLGHRRTKLDRYDMLAGMISDLEALRGKGQ